MAEENTTTEHSAKKAQKSRSQSKKKSSAKPKASAAKHPARAKIEAPASEQTVPSAAARRDTTKYIVTVDNKTGVPVKIEKVDEKTGKPKELSKEEYGAAMAYSGLAPASFAASQDYATPAADALMQAYYKGVADYLNALTSE